MSRVVVTGATGFIGLHLVPRLTEAGYEVLCLVRDPAKAVPSGDGVSAVRADLRHPLTYEHVLPSADHVIHLAGLLNSRRIVEYWEANVRATACLLETCRRVGAPEGRFLFMSTVAAMGPSRDGSPLRETDPCHPESEYGKSKLEAERVAGGYVNSLRLVILRPSFIFGPGDTRGLAALPWIAGHAPSFLESLVSSFSICHVSDLVEACLLSLKCGLRSGEVALISDPTMLTWGALRTILQPILQDLAPWMLTDRARTNPSGPAGPAGSSGHAGQCWACEVAKARLELGFTPRESLASRMRETLQWYCDHGMLSASARHSSTATGGVQQ